MTGSYFKNFYNELVFLRTYARNKEDGAIENWKDVIDRVCKYSFDIIDNRKKENTEKDELHNYMLNHYAYPAGRTLWIGGTKISYEKGLANYNCSGIVLDKIEHFGRIMYALSSGCGVGFRIRQVDIDELNKNSKFNNNIKLEFKNYSFKGFSNKKDHTSYRVNDYDRLVIIEVGDSREGWRDALDLLLKFITNESFHLNRNFKIIIDFDNVRPKGSKLHTFGGYASGHEVLQYSFENIFKILIRDNKFTVVNCLDIINLIAYCIVSGGVRRSAEIALSDNIPEYVNAKKENGWIELYPWRAMSNNSIMFYERPSISEIEDLLVSIYEYGEPGFVNAERALKIRNDFSCINPCVTADTWIMTNEGAKQVKDLIGKPFIAVVNGKEYKASGFYKTGYKKVYELETRYGFTVKLTDNHKVLVYNENDFVWKALKDIKPGEYVSFHDHYGYKWTSTEEGNSYEDYLFLISKLFFNNGKFSYDNDKMFIIISEGDNLNLLRFYQRILLRLGIFAKIIYKNNCYQLIIIDNDQIARFLLIIKIDYYNDGYKAITKDDVLTKVLKETNDKALFIDEVISITELGYEDVYDCSVEEVNAFDANGFYVHNCAEILFGGSGGLCNLVTINLEKFSKNITAEEERIVRLITRHAIRILNVNIEDEFFKKELEKDNIIGVSITALDSFLNKHNLDYIKDRDFVRQYLLKLRKIIHDEVNSYSRFLGIRKPLLSTCVKPNGNLGEMSGTSPGIHPLYAPVYIRRIRMFDQSPIAQSLIKSGLYYEKDVYAQNTYVFPFLIKTNAKKYIDNYKATDILEMYKTVQNTYTDHNTSVTVQFDKYEIRDISRWIYDNWDYFVAVSFLAKNDNNYPQKPFEIIKPFSEYKFNIDSMIDRERFYKILNGSDISNEEMIDSAECQNGVCPIR